MYHVLSLAEPNPRKPAWSVFLHWHISTKFHAASTVTSHGFRTQRLHHRAWVISCAMPMRDDGRRPRRRIRTCKNHLCTDVLAKAGPSSESLAIDSFEHALSKWLKSTELSICSTSTPADAAAASMRNLRVTVASPRATPPTPYPPVCGSVLFSLTPAEVVVSGGLPGSCPDCV